MSGIVLWITGLPCAGKSTLAARAQAAARRERLPAVLLDGDAVRAALLPAPGYDAAGRDQFEATLARLAALIASQGFAVLVAATAHRRAWRDAARAMAPAFAEVHVATPLGVCERRDAKGLYAAARAGRVHHLPGLDARYEPPLSPEVTATGGEDALAVQRMVALARAALTARQVPGPPPT
ncbi:adenylyl-sulfate kinase [Anaeromyxobacter diazotrophicus]|uniref:Adenylyl-sulfate kinase n=1 Tax=Anaeromyxobacter diazotrophicus TaxID=2590199 RepID=A0A7I9VHV7_9BACT|nr:adenylyl-sulfate kinase [Anaeromyxobacter diazotrophicus]GEJ55992.1 adenylyl-sulfate kinase [Anaeromyxobacter diazotrophicus]